ncbi:LysR substrate-binding domain-containing protein [Bordetella petrii]|uniref:LysR substrate-binding domain-containing protein n=1 Tax=Bordetella petrii TaxID=94624 RepID=UPI001A96271A|nr:LysR substrate-binding domain-containing protein [Bordetella petrii]MBO1113835.1 LysR family transcriptional regulator [Bordetella petrii]
MDSRQLRYFVKTLEIGSLTHAAQALHIAQSALSRHMRNLEDELGVRLLNRSKQGVEATPQGALLLEHGRNILRQFEQARQEVMSLGAEPFGQVVLGIPATVSPILIRPLLEAVGQAMPKVVLRIIEGMSGHLLEWLHSGRLDIAVLFDVMPKAGLNTAVIGQEAIYLVGAAGKFKDGAEVPLRELGRYPLITPGGKHGISMLIRQAAARENVDLQIRVEVDAFAEMIDLVREGLGYTMLARMGFHRELKAGAVSLAHIVDPPILRTLVVATPKARPLSPAAQFVIDSTTQLLQAFIAAEPAGKRRTLRPRRPPA